MKIIDYKKLAKSPADTLFATINKMNELGEVLVLGEYPDGRRFIYSPLADVSCAGNKEIDFDDNAFNRAGMFVVFEMAEVKAMCEKFMGIVNFQKLDPTDHRSLLKSDVKATIDETLLVTEGVPIVPVYSRESAKHFVDSNLFEPVTAELDGVQFLTAPLAIGERFSLLGIGQTQSLLETGILDMTDAIDPDIALDRVYLHLETLGKADEVVGVTVLQMPTSQAHFAAKGSYRQLDLNFYGSVALLAGAGTVQGEASKILTNGWVPTIGVFGSVNLETGETYIDAKRTDSFMQGDQLVRIKVIGYKLKAKRVNHNRRPRKAA
jgi:hypothetical protein